MRLLSFLTAALLAAALAGPAAAFGSSSKGTTGGQFLSIGPGARAAAMGGAFSGVADDVYAVYYNPAGLADLKRVEIAGMTDQRFQGVTYNFAALSVPLLAWSKGGDPDRKNADGVLGAAVYNLSVGGIPTQGTSETDTPTGTTSSEDFAYSLSYAYAFGGTGLSAGVTGKAIDSTLAGYKASAFAADAGVLYKWDRLSLGAGVRNMGTKYGFAGQADPLPLLAYGGAGAKLGERMLLSVEVSAPRDNDLGVAAGAEYTHPFSGRVKGMLRAGYNTLQSDAGGLSGVSLGAGLGVGDFGFDVALTRYGDLGDAYRYSLTVKF